MKFLLVPLFLIVCGLSHLSANDEPKLNSATVIRLDDVQGLFGGQNVVVDVYANLFVRKVSKGKQSRYHLRLKPEELTALMEFIGSSGIQDYREKKRNAVFDEAYPTITMTLPQGKKIEASKLANDKDPKFDKLYARLLELVEKASQTTPYSTGDLRANEKYP